MDSPEDRQTQTRRDLVAPDGSRWTAFAHDAIVAHGRTGAILAFRKEEGDADDVLHSTITFNSMDAAEFALGSMSEKDLLRRLRLARQAADGL